MSDQSDEPSGFVSYFLLTLSLFVNCGFVEFGAHSILQGGFNEGSGAGGHVIRRITMAGDPVDFWVWICVPMLGGIVFLAHSILHVVRFHARKRNIRG